MSISLNGFRIAGDLLHLLSIIILLRKIKLLKSCHGISLKSQELYALVFVTRYLDIFYNFISMYNTIMKLVFLSTSFAIIYLMRYNSAIRATYDKEHDTFRTYFLIIPCAILALFINHDFTLTEILWTFSIYLEAVAILPQLFLLQRTREIDIVTGDYVFTLGGYRAMYLLNWIYRYFTEENYFQMIIWVAGTVQTCLYLDFFYYYLKSKWEGSKLSLPK